MARAKIICLYCKKEKPHRNRGLCWSCYNKHRHLYSHIVRDKSARRGYGSGTVSPKKPQPTTAPPGSNAKVVVLMNRARNGESLHHENDERDVDGTLIYKSAHCSRCNRSVPDTSLEDSLCVRCYCSQDWNTQEKCRASSTKNHRKQQPKD